MSELPNMVKNPMNIFNTLSFYSPIIICISVLVFSLFTQTFVKSSFYFLCVFIATGLRALAFWLSSKGTDGQSSFIPPDICLIGSPKVFVPKDVSYSTFILTFTMAYFIVPMVLISAQNKINMMNYSVLFFFLVYILLDIYVKYSLKCFLGAVLIISNVAGAILLGIGCVIAMYSLGAKKYLYINETNTNKEVCSMPSKQQFKCNVYRNGELVGNL